MAQTKYTYSIATDTANAKLAADALKAEYEASAIVTALDYISSLGDVLDIYTKDALSTGDKTLLDGVVNAHQGVGLEGEPTKVRLDKQTPAGVSLISMKKPDGISFTRVSHDFCDKTTWYTDSVQVTDEVLTGSGVGPYTSANTYWIDVLNGKVFQEYNLSQYAAVVKVNDVVQTSGFTINYANGSVTFDSDPGGTVKASYYYNNGSNYILEPESGKVLGLEHSEIQFAKNASLVDPVNFEIWVYNPLFDPQQTVESELKTYNPFTDPFRNQSRFLYKFEKYKNIKDIINSANLGQGYIPACGGLTNDILVFPFKYVTEIKLAASQGGQLRITIDGNSEFTGEWATATFYCTSEDE